MANKAMGTLMKDWLTEEVGKRLENFPTNLAIDTQHVEVRTVRLERTRSWSVRMKTLNGHPRYFEVTVKERI